jgi:hypothetical protein
MFLLTTASALSLLGLFANAQPIIGRAALSITESVLALPHYDNM